MLHSLCGLGTHFLRDVSIDIQRKAGGGVAEVLLHRLDVVTIFQTCNSKEMAKVMES